MNEWAVFEGWKEGRNEGGRMEKEIEIEEEQDQSRKEKKHENMHWRQLIGFRWRTMT